MRTAADPLLSPPRPPLPPGPYVVAGLGRAGRAAATALVARDGAGAVRAWDGETRPDTTAAADELEAAGARVSLGGDGRELLDGPSPPRCLVKSPGLPFESPLVSEARKRRISVLDEAEVGWRLDGRPLIGVTGTNGKGTCAALVRAALSDAGYEPLLAGNTHFGPPLSEAPDHRGDVVVAELSSFQLAGSPSLLPEASLFTNLGQQHWDYHGSRAAYAEAKRRMFIRGRRTARIAALNVDDPDGRRLAGEIARAAGPTATYGTSPDADYRLIRCDWSAEHGAVEVTTPSGPLGLDTRLAGAHNAMNVAGALALVGGLGLDGEATRRALAEMSPVPGRFEAVSEGQPFALIVDFAHNPHGIDAALTAGRRLVDHGAGGQLLALGAPLWVHDPPMRRAAVRMLRERADEAVITTQRWRTREPLRPPPDVLEEAGRSEGCPCTVVEDRAEAIQRLVDAAGPGDVVMLLGRGALTGSLYDGRDRPRPFADRAVAEEALRRRPAIAGA